MSWFPCDFSQSLSVSVLDSGGRVTPVSVPDLPADPALFLASFNRSEFAIERTNYRNLSSRQVALWFYGKSDQLSLSTGLNRNYYVARADNFALVQVSADSRRQTPAVLSVLVEKDQVATPIKLNPFHWVKVELEPSEEVTVSWKITPVENLRICNIPEDRNVLIDIYECTDTCGNKLHNTPDQFRVSGMQLGGEISKKVLVTDADIQESDLGFYASGDDGVPPMQPLTSAFYRAPDPDLAIDSCVGLVQ